ncbi:MAG: fucose isomerase [Planctomycetes bacterium GWF2_41_51]|nr:MAG: fucose isomerase [Planctomycetes bacterium GWF2_41_51]HBG25569.1 fucose isomerase [Phycisphaerales bacterium]
MQKLTFGVIVGNRGFFPDALAKEGREDMLAQLKAMGIGSVALTSEQTKHGSVETFADAKKCAKLFTEHSNEIDGIIVTLPNFGDEKGVTESIKRSGLNVPVLIHAESDDMAKMTNANRRDSFCGKISVCNNLNQAMIPYTLTAKHTIGVKSADFKKDLEKFASVCAIVKGLRNLRFGAIGARTGAFNTVRYSEKLLEANGIAIETIDLSEILGKVAKINDNDALLKAKLNAITSYINTDNVPNDSIMKMAKFGLVIDNWMKDLDLRGSAIQCWTSLQEFFGIMPCTLMSMMSESLLPSACEVDIAGLLGMYILQQASQTPSAILDWNNNYGDDPDKCVVFHCSNLPKSFFKTTEMDYNAIIGSVMGKSCSYGTVSGKIKPGPATYCRISTNDRNGNISAYVGEGKFVDCDIESFGGYGVMEIPNMQMLMQHICKFGFEHHVAVSMSNYAAAINEALTNYMNWNVYLHQ